MDKFSTFVNPRVPIPYRITNLTSITDEMVMDSPGIEEILPKFPEACSIGGMTMGADPISLAIGMYSASAEKPLCVFTVRKEAKDHGRGKRIEGNFAAGQQVIVVDDVITTGGSTLKAIDAIEAEGGKVVAALVLVDREEGGREAIEGRGIPVFPMFTRSSIFGDK